MTKTTTDAVPVIALGHAVRFDAARARFAFLGRRGSGKTYAAGVLIASMSTPWCCPSPRFCSGAKRCASSSTGTFASYLSTLRSNSLISEERGGIVVTPELRL